MHATERPRSLPVVRGTNTVRWAAAVNPTGEPFEATTRVEGLSSRRAALRWLLANAEVPR